MRPPKKDPNENDKETARALLPEKEDAGAPTVMGLGSSAGSIPVLETFLLKLSDALRPLASSIEIQATATQTAMSYFGADRCYYCEIENYEAIIRQDASRKQVPSVVGVYSLKDFPILQAVIEAGRPFTVEDAHTTDLLDESMRQMCVQMGIISFVDIPVIKDGQPVGVLCVTQGTPRQWTAQEVALASEVAERIWAAVVRVRAEEALRESEAKYRMLFDSIDEGFCTFDMIFDEAGNPVDYRFVEYNAAFEKHTGLTNAVGRTVREFLPDQDQHWFDIYGRVAMTGEPIRVNRYGEALKRWIEVYAFRIGKPEQRRVAALFSDVTTRVETEEALQESEQRKAFSLQLSDLLRPQTDPIAIQETATKLLAEKLDVMRATYFEVDPDQNTVTLTARYEQDALSIPNRMRLSDFSPDLTEGYRSGKTLLVRDTETEAPGDEQREAYRAIGVRAWAAVPLVKNGELVAIVAVHSRVPRDWTDTELGMLEDLAERTWAAVARAHAETAQRTTEERFRLLVEGATDYAMFLLDMEARITFWSTGAERIFGWTEEEAMGQPGLMIFTPEDIEKGAAQRELEKALIHGRALDRRWHMRKDRSLFWADGVLMRLDDDAGNPRGFAKVARDATGQKHAEVATQAALEAVAEANEALEHRVEERTRELSEMSELRQELLRKLVAAQEEERGRISRDLHDDTGQQVAALLLTLGNLMTHPALTDSPDAMHHLEKAHLLAEEVTRKSHRLSFNLRPTGLDDLGLMGALHHYAEVWTGWSGVPTQVTSAGFDDGTRLPSELETTIYRVAQEALTNILKHATGSELPEDKRATRVSIVVQRMDGGVLAIIEDNGPGFDVEATLSRPPGQRRLGIFGMQERARLVGGTLDVESDLGKGTTVYLRLPLPPAAEA